MGRPCSIETAGALSCRVERRGGRRVLKVSAAGACEDAVTIYLPGCNLACRHCWAGADREDPEGHGAWMSFAEMRRAVRRFRRHNRVEASATNVRLSGGEPILSERFFDLLDGLLPLPGTIHIETNGVMLGARPAFAARLAVHGSRIFVKVSIKAGTAAQFERIAGRAGEGLDLSFRAVESLWLAGVPFDTNSLCRDRALFTPEEERALLDRLGSIHPDLCAGHEAETLTAYPHTLRRMAAAGRETGDRLT